MPSIKYDDTYPWFSRVISRKEKLLALAGYIVVFLASCWLYHLVLVGTPEENVLLRVICFFIVAVVATLGLIWLLRILRTPTFTALAAAKARTLPFVLGKPFIIQHLPRFGDPIWGMGTLKFTGAKLSITGKHAPEISTIALSIIICTVIPLMFIGVGLGLGLAFYAAYRMGSKPYQRTVAYTDITSFKITGGMVEMVFAGAKPDYLKFRVGLVDGERFYRELYARHPEFVAKWQPEMQRVISEQPSVGW